MRDIFIIPNKASVARIVIGIRKEIGILVLFIINYYCLYNLPVKAIEILGKNESFSPYIFFTGLLFLIEIILYSIAYSNFNVVEMAIGGVKFSRAQTIDIKEYMDTINIIKQRMAAKAEAENKIIQSMNSYLEEVVEQVVKTPLDSKEIYKKVIHRLLEDYIKHLGECKEKGLKVDIYWKKDAESAIIEIRTNYKLSQYNMNMVEDLIINPEEPDKAATIEELNNSYIFIPVKSSFNDDYLIIVFIHEEDQTIDAESYIISNMVTTLDACTCVWMDAYDGDDTAENGK